MKIVERRVQVAVPGKWDDAMAHETRWAEADAQYEAPLKRRLRSLTGAHAYDTYVWEREWDSMAAMESHYMKQLQDATLQPLMAYSTQLWENNTVDYYFLLD